MKTKKVFALVALTVLAASGLGAQQSWHSEFGIQGGFARVKPAGTGAHDQIDLFDLPGFSLAPLIPSYSSVFFIVPWQKKLAIEPSFSVAQLQGAGNATLMDLGLRVDYALTPKFYGAAGITAGHINNSGTNSTQFGVLAAVGYHGHLVGPLNGRAEARVNLLKKTNELSPTDVYGVLLGLSTPIHGGAAPSRRAAPAGRSAWARVLGISAGYSQTHGPGSGTANDITILSFPGYGGGFAAFGSPTIVLPPTLFAVFPIGDKMAIEPGFDFHRFQSGGTTSAGANIAARLDYAIHGGWYAAAGGDLSYIKTTGASAVSRPGATLASGFRFHLVSDLGSRIELSHTMWKKHDNPKIRPVNVTSIMWSVTLPLR
jgi:hypothetical protein